MEIDKETLPPIINETLAFQTKCKYKSYVNIGNDWIYMEQKVPDFFLIRDPELRQATIEEF